METNTAGDGVVIASREGRENRLEWSAGKLLLLAAFLLPFFFIPIATFPLQGGKALLFSIFVLLSLCLWILARLKGGAVSFPHSPLFFLLFLIAAVSSAAALFSGVVSVSFFGQVGEIGTAVSILIAVLFALLLSMLFRTREQIFGGLLFFLAAFFLLALFHLSRLFLGPGFLSFGMLTDTAANTIGKWNDVGVFFGAAALLSLFTLEFLSLRRFFKVLLFIALILSLFFVTLVNFATLWFLLGVFALVFLVYLISFGRGNLKEGGDAEGVGAVRASVSRRLPLPSLIMLLVPVFFLLAGTIVGREVAETFRINAFEARPSWGATIEVAQKTLAERPFFGAGPNKFVNEWLRFKPDGINQTVFWNVDFNYGIGLIPTFLVTTGILGFLSWAAFFLLFLYAGFKAVLSDFSDAFSRYLITSTFLLALFFWLVSVFYVSSGTNFAFSFFFTGLFIAALAVEGRVLFRRISFMDNPRAGFVSVLALVILFIGAVSLGYTLVQKYAAAVHFERGVAAARIRGDLTEAERQFTRAASLHSLDLYYRFLSELNIIRMGNLLAQRADALSAEALRGEFESLIGGALSYAREATARDGTNYQNFMQLGRVYEAVVPLRITGAYESANTFYEKALTLNPRSPALFLAGARLAATQGDRLKAREQISKALAEKGNYTEAVFLLSQIEAQEGNITAAISSAEAATTLAPEDSVIFFQLGLLRYGARDFQGAARALKRAVDLNSVYANAKYFLGLSYYELRRREEAIQQFTDLKETNPNVAEVDLILGNLKAGRTPFAGATPPVDDRPERRPALPLSEGETP
ncbi:MAG: Tfp pilus assembly protein PilF [Parcubacteria group bacterium Greene0416_79]|nr:MAG: Tfp pilus assembly protein PilF [Parcubacteria group bacterium Greene0416_79]